MDISDSVINLLLEEPEFEEAIRQIIDFEESEEGSKGWTTQDVNLSEREVSKLEAREILSSRRDRQRDLYSLADRPAVKEALRHFWSINQIRSLVEENPEYRRYLEKALDAYRRNPLKSASAKYGVSSGFKSKDLAVPSQILSRLADTGALEKISSSPAVYTVPDTSTIEKALQSTTSERGAWLDDVVVTEEDISKFEKILKEKDGLEYWHRFINPKLRRMEEQQKAALISLASLDDMFGDRNRIHVLLLGEPGTGKSELIRWISTRLEAGFCTHRTTDVGLTGDARGNSITPGALPLNHGGMLCVDELDKFDSQNRFGFQEAMSDGEVRITAGGMEESFPAQARVIACTNETDFRPEFHDRFDFRIPCETPSREEKADIVGELLMDWNLPKEGHKGVALKKFLKWIRGFTPMADEKVKEKGRELLESKIKEDETERGTRQYLRYIRSALAIARLNHRNLKIEDYERAINFIDRCSL